MFRTLSLVLCLVAVSHQLNFVQFSVPKAVEADTEAELTCEHDGDETVSITKWFWKPFVGGKSYQVYQHSSNSDPPQKIILPRSEPALNITLKEEGEHNLLLWGLQPGHSGTFECEVEEEKGDFQERRNSSDLVVFTLGNGPELSYEGDEEVLISCAAVGVAPEPELISISYDSTTFNTTIKVGPTDDLYNISTNATLPREDIEGKEITCRLSFVDNFELPPEVMQVTGLYHSDAWYATTTPAVDDDDASATPQAELLIPDGAARAGGAWLALALAVALHLRPMLELM